ncbi:extracellular solute-binding protein [Acetatifactor aquisgranensis]|uniref:extracellular solute-binding protein n=1 Tax=Acetatifactor aquisgranensis TaxID=2941233 RepID=UPI002040C742|nr:extracellular solute-binding protein [Acetatifactor aquisgranensis]MCI8542941.1 extracellular solute-binding protein [Lachnospiraceae bacterium]
MKKKMLAVLLASAMLASLATGCGSSPEAGNAGSESAGSDDSESAAPEESVSSEDAGAEAADASPESGAGAGGQITFPLAETENFSMLCVINGDTPMEEVDAFQYLNEQSNVTFEVNSVPSGDAAEKESLIISSGTYPDVFIFSSLGKDNIDRYGSEGVFIPLEDYIRTYAPNLTALLDERELWPFITAPDGHVYEMPALNSGAELEAGFHIWLNFQWLENLNLEAPKSLEDLHDILTAFKEQDANGNGDANDEIPLSVPDGMGYLLNYLPYFGYNMDGSTRCAAKDGNLVYVPTDDGYKEFLRYFTQLYQEGLLDPASFTQNYDQIAAKGSAGDVLGCFCALASFQFAGREQDEKYQIIDPFEGQDYPLSTGIMHGSMMITDACEKPEILVAWADRLYTEEGGELYWLGVEGRAHVKNEDGTWSWNIGGPIGDDIETIREKGTLKDQTAFPGLQPDLWFTGITDPDESYLIGQRGKMLEWGKLPLPAMSYTAEETETIASLKADLDSYVNQYGAQVITGELDLDASWDDYKSTMETMGAAELYDIYLKAFQEAQ